MILMIDNYDSFTFMIVQYLKELGGKVLVKRHDEISVKEVEKLQPSHIVISPGPCTPNEAGISMDLISFFMKKIPILGVCLGHQCIVQALGGTIEKAKIVMHGKTSTIYHNASGVFSQVKNPFTATRYHSLVANKENIPDCLEVNAWTQTSTGEQDEIMGVRHKQYELHGVQFHPESVLTEGGHQLIAEFLKKENKKPDGKFLFL